MNVNLTPELEKLVQDKVKSGLYNNQSEVVREALRLLAERDALREARLHRIRAGVARGLAQAERGEGIPAEEAHRQIREEYRRNRARRED
jgi:antitoxin ParD1/3/4